MHTSTNFKRNHRGQRHELFQYLFNLKTTIRSPQEFKRNWNKLPKAHLSKRDLIDILKRLENNIFEIGKENPALAKECLIHVVENFYIWEKSAANHIKDFKIDDISHVLAKTAGLGIDVDKVFVRPLLKRHFAIDVVNSARIKWACAVLDSQFDNNLYRAAYLKAPAHSTYKKTSLVQDKMFHDAEIWFQESTQIPNPTREGAIGNYEARLSNIFNKAGLHIRTNSHTLDTFVQASDIRVTDGSNEIHIEDDGLYHFLYGHCKGVGEMPYNGKSRFRNALLQKTNPTAKILRIPFNTTKDMISSFKGNKGEMAARFMNLFKQCAEAKPGVYRASFVNDNERIQPFTQTAEGCLWSNQHAGPQ